MINEGSTWQQPASPNGICVFCCSVHFGPLGNKHMFPDYPQQAVSFCCRGCHRDMMGSGHRKAGFALSVCGTAC